MTKQDIIDYVMETPGNTNRAVLTSMLNQIENTSESGDNTSDFSIAEVTVTNYTQIPVLIPRIQTRGNESAASPYLFDVGPISVILYKGLALAGLYEEAEVSVTGDIQYLNNNFLITGNGTITITDKISEPPESSEPNSEDDNNGGK